uniref:nuclear transport factor 2 family protein n=1 Tax=Nocardia brasiliensis TaxID=37326 RepID=UPI0024586F41
PPVPGLTSPSPLPPMVLPGLPPKTTQRRTLPARGAAPPRDLAKKYMLAWEAGDVDTIVTMLTEDVRYSMPPLSIWYEGLDGVREFLVDTALRHRWRFRPAQANGQLAFGTYRWAPEQGTYIPSGLDLLLIRDRRVAEVVSFLDADFPSFGLPAQLTEKDL